MSKILPDGFVNTDILSDFSVFSLNNTVIGQYAGKIIKGNDNLIIGNNAGKIGIDINNSIFLGANSGTKLTGSERVISIGDENSKFRVLKNIVNIGYDNNINESSNFIKITNDRPLITTNNIGLQNKGFSEVSIGNYNSNLNSSINIGTSNISLINNSITIGNNLNNNFNLNIDNVLCSSNFNNNEYIYLACGAYKDFPVILGSSNNFDLASNTNLSFSGNFITSQFKLKNSENYSILFNTNTNINLIYNFPTLPNYEYSYLSTDNDGNLVWLPVNNDMIRYIITSGTIICNNFEGINLLGDGSFITNVNITIGSNTTDDLKQGVKKFYFNNSLLSTVFYDYIKGISTDDINEGSYNQFFELERKKKNFKLNLK